MAPKKMTIEVEGKGGTVPLSSFISIVQETLNTLQSLEEELLKKPKGKKTWKIESVRMSSPLTMVISPEYEKGMSRKDVVGPFVRGLRTLEVGRKRPRYFGDTTLTGTKRMLSIMNDGISAVTFSATGVKPVKPTQKARDHAELLVPTTEPYWVYTQLEGTLENIITHGRTEFHIFDPITDRKVRCTFDREKAHEVLSLGLKRVRVSGDVKFDENHRPIEVQVDSYERLRDQSELPQIADLHKAKINITGGKDSVEYVRGLRDAE
jgi:hypothetical protein